MRYSRDQLLEIQPSTPNFELVNRLRELRLGVGLPRKRGCRGGRKKLRSIQVVPSRNLHPLMVPPFLQPHPDLQSAVGNAPLSSKHPTQLPTTDCLLSIIPLMGGQPSDAPALSPPSPLQQGGQSSNAPALSPPSQLPQGGQPIALALSPSSPPPQDGQPSDAPGLSPSSSTLLPCPSDSILSICHLNSQSAVKTGMALWGARRAVYKVGVMVQHLGFLLFVVGFSTPFWFYASPGDGSQGLWQYCNGRCHKLQVEEEWFEGVRALLCLTLIVYLVACGLAVCDNCLKKYDPLTYRTSRRIEITTAAAGLMGAVGMSVYSIMMEVDYQEYTRKYFGAAYGVTIAGCGLALTAAVILSASGASPLQNDYVTLRTPAGRSVMVMYQATSHGPATTNFSAGTPAPAWNPTSSSPPPAYDNTPSYMHKQASASGYNGVPVAFSDPSRASYPAPAPVFQGPGSNDVKAGPSARIPPPYLPPSAPPGTHAFIE
ncbi:hypothetical protein ACOMHN_030012 [Nucella lapillus]